MDENKKSDAQPSYTPVTPELHPLPRTFEGKLYYGASDVAKIIGVSRVNVLKWHQKGLFTADIRAHDNTYLYEVERVMQLKAVYHKDWTRGGYQPSPTTSNTIHYSNEELINQIKELEPDVLEAHGIISQAPNFSDKRPVYICPFCGSGSHENQTSAFSPVFKDGIWKWFCHSCMQRGEGKDNIHLLAHFYNLDCRHDFPEILKRAANDFLLDNNFQPKMRTPLHKAPPPKEKIDPLRLININDTISKAQKNLADFIDRQGGSYRALPLPVWQHFNCGYLRDWSHSKKFGKTPRIIIPASVKYDKANYLARLTVPFDSLRESQRQFTSEKEHDGIKTLFNPAALSADLIFVVEGYIDAMSLYFASKHSVAAVALGGANQGAVLLDALAEKNISGKKFILLFDADQHDKNFPSDLKIALENGGNHAVTKFLIDFLPDDKQRQFGIKVDANQLLQECGADFLFLTLKKIIDSAKTDFYLAEKTLPVENIEEKNKRDLDAAVAWIESLTPEKLTADDALKPESIHKVALVLKHGFHSLAEKFFAVIKKAKTLGKNRIKESDADLTKKIDDSELNEINALVEGVNIDFLRRSVFAEVKAIEKAHADFLKNKAKEDAEKRRQERAEKMQTDSERLKELQEMPQSDERDAEIIQIINSLCQWRHDKFGNPVAVAATAANVNLIFKNDPNIQNLIGYNQFLQTDVLLKSPVWNPDAKRGDEWSDRDDSQLQMYLREKYTEFANNELVANAIVKYSDFNRFHEVKEFFYNLPKWDGIPRAEKLLVTFLGADDTPYTREITLNVLTAAVARIFHPGCEYQLAPILLGAQGIGKSFLLARVFGKWYGCLVDDVSDPHAIDAIQNLWGVEIKEMAAMKKDVDANKRFIDSAKDTRRQAYARRAVTIPRHCVFFITTNNQMCLTDMTGNRRFPIIKCNNPPRHYVEGLTDEFIQQLWAEVFAHYNELFKDGFDEKKLELSRAVQMQSDDIAQEHLRDDGMESEIRAGLDTMILPLPIWNLMTREERRDFIKNGRLVMINAVTEFNHRRRAKGGRPAVVQRDVDLISDLLTTSQSKPWLRTESKTIQGNSVEEFIIYGSVLREHICAAEIYNEFFGNDRRKSTSRIYEILNNLVGWSLGERIQKADPAYLDQKKVFYRDDL